MNNPAKTHPKVFYFLICLFGFFGDAFLAVTGISTFHRMFLYIVVVLLCFQRNLVNIPFYLISIFFVALAIFCLASYLENGTQSNLNTYLFLKILMTTMFAFILNYTIRNEHLHFVLDSLGIIVIINLFIVLAGSTQGWESVQIFDNDRVERYGFKGWLGTSSNEMSYFILPIICYASTILKNKNKGVLLFFACSVTCLLSGLKGLYFVFCIIMLAHLFFDKRRRKIWLLLIAILSISILTYLADLLEILSYFVYQNKNSVFIDFISSGRISRAEILLSNTSFYQLLSGTFPYYINFELGLIDIFYNFGLFMGLQILIIILYLYFPKLQGIDSFLYIFMLGIFFLFMGHLQESIMGVFGLIVYCRYLNYNKL